jgi:predicted nucleic acid-binding protein
MNILLDSGPLGLLCLPDPTTESVACEAWAEKMNWTGHVIFVPEIIVYEIRRELLRMGSRKSLFRLERLKEELRFLPLDSATLDKAAEYWAEARKRGKPTASQKALDIDVILAAQAWRVTEEDGSLAIIATMNAKHLSQFVAAEHWKDIHPI